MKLNNKGFAPSALVILLLGIMAVVMWVFVGLRIYERTEQNKRNEQRKNDALLLIEAAEKWRGENKALWPEICIVDPGVQKLCATGEDQEEIVETVTSIKDKYEFFTVESKYIEGEITDSKTIIFGLENNGLIIVSRASCFQGREISEGSQFVVIYGEETKNGLQAACV